MFAPLFVDADPADPRSVGVSARVFMATRAMRSQCRRAEIPALLHHVPTVVLLCANKQMAGVDAAPNVTPMQYAHAVRDVANERKVGKPMR
jgi:hypothetical protein